MKWLAWLSIGLKFFLCATGIRAWLDRRAAERQGEVIQENRDLVTTNQQDRDAQRTNDEIDALPRDQLIAREHARLERLQRAAGDQ